MNTNTELRTIRPVTQRFKLNQETINEIKAGIPKFGFNGLGEVVFRRTYSRDNESWADVVIRVMEGVMSIRKEHYYRNSLFWSDDEWQPFVRNMAISLFNMEWLPPGRGLWMMGTEFTYIRGSMALNNCAATDTAEDIVLSAEWTMDALMNGVGVGFTTYWRGVATAPDKTDSETFIIPDSREGWVVSLIKLMCAYIDSPKYGKCKFPIFDYSQIRAAGVPIKGFGGLSSGSDPLKKMHTRVTEYLDAFCLGRLTMTTKSWKETEPSKWEEVECLVDKPYSHTRLVADIFNSIGACVVAGNVRRCLPFDALVHTNKGLVRMENIKIGDQVLTLDGSYRKVSNKFNQGIQKIISVKTSHGFLRCTKNHKLAYTNELIDLGFEKAETLVTSSHDNYLLLSNTTLPGVNSTNSIDEKMACIFGVIQGCGVFEENNKIRLVFNDNHNMSIILNLLKKRLVLDNSIHTDNETFIDLVSSNMYSYFSSLGLDKQIIPDNILRETINIRLAYVKGLTYSMNTHNGSYIYKRLENKHVKQFIIEVQTLLNSCGIGSFMIKMYDSYGLSLDTDWCFDDDYNIIKCEDQNPVLYTKSRLVKAEFIEQEKNPVQTYDIEVAGDDKYANMFFCNGYLVHNSAEICLGHAEDEDFTNLKNYDKNPERSEIGWMSNNSVVLKADQDYEDFSFIPEMASRIRDNGEPGMINLYNIQKYGRYGKEMKDEATLVNPCFSGDTLIAVADGRGAVSIHQLTEENVDVPLYSMDPTTSEISIQWGRNPRITGTGKKLIRIHFSHHNKGEYLDVTPNHKFFLNDGRTVEAKDLVKGDSIPQFKKALNGKDDYIVVHTLDKRRLVEHRMIKEFHDKQEFYKTYKEGTHNGCCLTHGVVVHHKDEDKSHNHPDNLEITTAGEHNRIHNKEFIGSGNPMYGKTHTDETKNLIAMKVKERCADPMYRKKLSDAQTAEQRAISSSNMSKVRAKSLKDQYDEIEKNPCGLTIIRNSDVSLSVQKVCENQKCQVVFLVPWAQRIRAYCSTSCGNTNTETIKLRRQGQAIKNEEKARANFHIQAMLYKKLCAESTSTIQKKDFEQACKAENISCRFNAKTDNQWIPSGWNEFKTMVNSYNHQVAYIEELDGEHDVYNITVDVNHTLAVVTKTGDNIANLSGVYTVNCGEIPLCNFELCNLAETFPPRCKNLQVFYQALKYATFYSSTVSLLPTHRPETNAIIAKNRRIGISISGIAQWASSDVNSEWGDMNYTKMTKFLREGYRIIREYNAQLASQAGIPASIRVSTIKPSGSISLLAGCTPGVHYPISRYAIRRMRIGSNSPLVPILKAAGIPNEPDTYSDNTTVFEFMIDHGNVRPCEEVSPWEQFSLVAMLQRCYADNCVSATIYFDKKKDGSDVEKLLAMYIPILKSVSMLPHSGHGYKQAPYEPVDKETYEKLCSKYTNPDFSSITDNVPEGSKFCSGDTCEL